tara:strand:+ start:53 stop:307 length:255 start_codon:yes stop_codon:yes gene_type:complete
LDFRKKTTQKFPSVFKKGTKKSVSSNYGWFAIIDGLSNGDVLKIDAITKLPMMLCLTKLSLDADRNIEREKEARQNQNKSKARR